MGKALPPSASSRKIKAPSFGRHEKPEMQALKEENTRLRELVTQLSELVIKNIVADLEEGGEEADRSPDQAARNL
jgi:hypothetical protein